MLADIGACILQKMTNGTLKPIAHASRALLPGGKIICKSKKKLLRLYSQSQSSTIIFMVNTSLYKQTTSHYSPFLPKKKGLPTHTANRLQRWDTILLNYNFKMEYLPLKKFGHVGRLSRLIPKYKKITGRYSDHLLST